MRIAHTLIAVLCAPCALSLMSPQANASSLYGATAAGGPGELYTLNPAAGGMLLDIGPLNDVTGLNYGITGMAFSPLTGVLYGSVSNSVAATQAQLVTINPATAQVTVVGHFNVGNAGTNPSTMADIAFDSAGNLYGVGSVGGPQLYSINTATAQATVIGGTGLTSTSGGGLGISPTGTFSGSPSSSRFGTYDSTTGAFTNITSPTKPVGGAYAALAYDGATLYGLDLGPGSAGTPDELVTIDPVTGAVTDIGASVNFLDSIAFTVPEPTIALSLGALALLGVARRQRN